jgi:hypothetical protein
VIARGCGGAALFAGAALLHCSQYNSAARSDDGSYGSFDR